jgi:hypothetical protein
LPSEQRKEGLDVNSDALGLVTPSEIRSLYEPFNDKGGPIVRCYYCTRGGASETTVLKDGEPVTRWVCVEHAAHSLRTTCYYCAREDTSETTVLKDGQPVTRWVCVEHAAHPPKRVGGSRLRRVVHSSSRSGSRTHLLRRR